MSKREKVRAVLVKAELEPHQFKELLKSGEVYLVFDKGLDQRDNKRKCSIIILLCILVMLLISLAIVFYMIDVSPGVYNQPPVKMIKAL